MTGGSSGLGYATCQGLVQHGFRVVLTSRDPDRAAAAARRLGAEGMQLDLASLASVRTFVAAFLERYSRLDVLIHNAGTVEPRRRVTEDGFETQFQVTYLAPFLLDHLLLQAVRPERIINVASDLHRGVELVWDDLQSERDYQFVKAYGRAELARILYTYELARRCPDLTVNCLHPGGVRTRLFRNFRGPLAWLLWLSDWLKQSPTRGAATSLYLATADPIGSGGYYVARRLRPSSPASRDLDSALRLWELSCQLLSIQRPDSEL
ncbi:MAG: SDR family NAD(P)-dependent oxidoreductase [Vulcanimicrobiota bacterium]